MAEAGKFFISLGLNGAEKTLSGLSQINDHFGGLKTLSTEAKLAILAALAGLEQIVSVGGKFGSQMTMLHEHLNVSIQDLQKYGNAAKIAGASTEDMFTAFSNIQDAINSIHLYGKAAPFMPTLLGLIQQSHQNITTEDILKMGTEKGGDVKFLNLLRGLIRNPQVNQYLLYKMISDNGMLPTSIYDVFAMNGGKTFDKALGMAPTVSTANVEKLNNLNMNWQQTLERFEVAMENFAATPWVGDLVKGLDAFADATNKFVLAIGAGEGKVQTFYADLYKKLFPENQKNVHMTNVMNFYLQENDQGQSQRLVDYLKKGGFKATLNPPKKTHPVASMSSTVTGQ